MILENERAQVVAACQEMQRQGLVVGTAGNVSARAGDLVAISPSGVEYGDLTPQMVGVHRLDGTQVEGDLAPSSELPLHMAVYSATSAGAITHNHAPASSALGLVVDQIPTSHYYSAMFGGPVRVAPYATFGSPALANAATAALSGRTGALMANHGAITIGPTVPKALSLLAYLEYICDIQLRAMYTCLPVKTLPVQEINRVVELLKGYGQPSAADSG